MSDACAAQFRCTHNVKTTRQLAKPGSGLATLTQGFTYESAFNKVATATATDARGQVTSYTYTAQGLLLAVTSPADASGVQPVTTYGYTAYTASGFPAFYLQTSVSQETSASNTVQSSTSYNAANKYVPQTVVADSGTGKLNLTSTSTFDAVGNLSHDTGGRLRVVSPAGVATSWLYDGQDLVAEYNSASVLTARYVHGSGVDEPLVSYTGTGVATKNWLYADHLGSIVAQADASGTNAGPTSTAPSASRTPRAGGTRFRYTGQQLLEQTGLYHYKARVYDPRLGRFLQTDSLGTADDMNLYAYVGTNPINYIDSTGDFGLAVEPQQVVHGRIAGAKGVLAVTGVNAGPRAWLVPVVKCSLWGVLLEPSKAPASSSESTAGRRWPARSRVARQRH